MKNTALTQQANAALESGIPEDELFTPILASTETRVVMRVDAEQLRKLTRGPGQKAIITDKLTGMRFRVDGRSCGLPNCYCDATVTRVDGGNK